MISFLFEIIRKFEWVGPRLNASSKHIFRALGQAKKGKNSKRNKKSVYLKKGLGKQMENWLCNDFFARTNEHRIQT